VPGAPSLHLCPRQRSAHALLLFAPKWILLQMAGRPDRTPALKRLVSNQWSLSRPHTSTGCGGQSQTVLRRLHSTASWSGSWLWWCSVQDMKPSKKIDDCELHSFADSPAVQLDPALLHLSRFGDLAGPPIARPAFEVWAKPVSLEIGFRCAGMVREPMCAVHWVCSPESVGRAARSAPPQLGGLAASGHFWGMAPNAVSVLRALVFGRIAGREAISYFAGT
jgi:hypothetical protein